MGQLAPMLIEPMAEPLPTVIDMILAAPVVEAAAGDVAQLQADLVALDDAQSAMQVSSTDIQTLTSSLFAEFSALDFGGDD